MRLTISILVMSLAVSCGDDSAPPDAAPSDVGYLLDAASTDAPVVPDAASPGVEVWYFGGVYFVPERSEVSTYPIFEATWTRAGADVGLFYNLPRMLTGDTIRVAMTGTAEGPTATLSGPLGSARCELDVSGLPTSCREEFIGIVVDLDRVQREAERDDPARVSERLAVAERFENDPIGVIEAGESLLGPVRLGRCSGPADCPESSCDIEDEGRSHCTPISPERAIGEPCALDFESAPGSKCDHEARVCEPE